MIDDQDDLPSSYGCVYTALRPSLVSHSTTGSFLGAGQMNLILAKNAYLEVYTLEDNQLHLQCQLPTYIRVRKLLTVKTIFPIDLVFLVLDLFFVVAGFDFETKELHPLFSEKILTRDQTDRADLIFTAHIPNDPSPKQFIASYSVNGVFMHFDFAMDLLFSEGHGLTGSVSLTSNDFILDVSCDIVDSIFLDGGYTVGLMIRDTKTQAISVRSYGIEPDQSILIPGDVLGTTADNTTSIFAPSTIDDGILTIGTQEINYFKSKSNKKTSFPQTEFYDEHTRKFRPIKECIALDSSLLLYGDNYAGWFIIRAEKDVDGKVKNFHRTELASLGEFECFSKLSRVQRDGYFLAYDVFLGMTKMDSQLVSIIPTNPIGQQVDSHADYNSFYATKAVVNSTVPNSTTIVGCSDRNNSLSILTNGANITEYAWFEQNNVRASWAVKKRLSDEYHSLLVFSFVGQTRVMRVGTEVTEVTIKSIRPDVETLYIGNASHGFIVHVTTQAIALLNVNYKIVHEWKVPEGVLSAAAACLSLVTVSQGNTLYTFRIEQHGLVLQASAVQSDDVAFIVYEMDSNKIGKTAIIALWRSNAIECLSLPSLKKLSTTHLREQTDEPVIRCLALLHSDLMIGLGDGRVLYYNYNTATHALTLGKSFKVGTTHARCISIDVPEIGPSFFFVGTDRPSLILHDSYGLRVVPANFHVPIWYVCPFKFEYTNAWALVACNDTHVKVFTFDNIENLLPTKFDLKEYTPCDIDHFSPHNLYAVICSMNGGAHIRLIDIDLPINHPQNQYLFTIDNDTEPLCICHLIMKNPKTSDLTDYLGAVTFTEENSTLSLYQIQKNSAGIFVVEECQSVQFENRVINMRCFKHMVILCCPESLLLVDFNTDGDLDFVLDHDGLYFHNVASDPQTGLIVPLSLSTELETFKILENDGEIEMERGSSYKCTDMPLKVAILNGKHKQVVASTLPEQLQFFFGPSNNTSTSRAVAYNLADTVSSISTKDGHVIYSTQSGGVGVCKLISKEDHEVLLAIQMQLSEHLQTLVPISHDEIRFNYSAIEDEEYIPMSHLRTNLIDGDFVVKFLTLRKELKDEIEKELNMNVTEFIQRFHEGLLFT